MKKLLAVCVCCTIALTAAGCSPGDVISRFVPAENTTASDTAAVKTRLYMDEIKGVLQDFDGSHITLRSGETVYTFDVSQAALECGEGMITGDEISIIYEGQLNGEDTDTSMVKPLKVVDEFHKKKQLKNRIAYGKVEALTPNTITLRSEEGKTATYPITGAEQYYQNGIKAGNWVYLHFKGKFPAQDENTPTVLNASHLKVLSISDIDPLVIPEPTPTPAPSEDDTEIRQEKQFQASIQNINMNTLQILPHGSDTPLNVDLSAVPSYFKGGIAPGSSVNIYYTGETDFDGSTLEGLTITAVTGADPDKINERYITSTVTGTITGSTANTVTIQTNDGAIVTCLTENVPDSSTGGLAAGSGLRITFNPSASRTSNIYTTIKIEDA